MAKALLVDDDSDILLIAAAALQAVGIVSDTATSLRAAASMIETYPYELLLVDLGLPDGNGATLLNLFNKYNPGAPALVISADSRVQTTIDLLGGGAQDYLTKPFNLEELQARARALLRRFQPPTLNEEAISLGSLTLDAARKCATVGNRDLKITKREFDVLRLLFKERHRELSQEEILSQCWGESNKLASLQVILSKLRKILSQEAPDLLIDSATKGHYRLTIRETVR